MATRIYSCDNGQLVQHSLTIGLTHGSRIWHLQYVQEMLNSSLALTLMTVSIPGQKENIIFQDG